MCTIEFPSFSITPILLSTGQKGAFETEEVCVQKPKKSEANSDIVYVIPMFLTQIWVFLKRAFILDPSIYYCRRIT